MPIHDAYARRTPYELLLPTPDFLDRGFAGVEAEADERGVDPANPAAFTMLGAVQGMLAELRPADAAAVAAHDLASVLYFAYRMWKAGPAVCLVRAATLRRWLAAEEIDGPSAARDLDALAGRAGYVQLPQHLLWMEGDEGSAEASDDGRESVDGLFWAADDGGILHLALATGLWRDRPGYTVVHVPPQPLAAMVGWASGPVRDDGDDYDVSLPGAEMSGLLGIRTPAEVYKLAALALGRLDVARDAAAPSPPDREADGSSPRPTGLPCVVL